MFSFDWGIFSLQFTNIKQVNKPAIKHTNKLARFDWMCSIMLPNSDWDFCC